MLRQRIRHLLLHLGQDGLDALQLLRLDARRLGAMLHQPGLERTKCLRLLLARVARSLGQFTAQFTLQPFVALKNRRRQLLPQQLACLCIRFAQPQHYQPDQIDQDAKRQQQKNQMVIRHGRKRDRTRQKKPPVRLLHNRRRRVAAAIL